MAELASVEAAAPAKAEDNKDKKDEELQGVFVVRNRRAVFVPVETGIDHNNVYLVREKDGWLVFDTGMDSPATVSAWPRANPATTTRRPGQHGTS